MKTKRKSQRPGGGLKGEEEVSKAWWRYQGRDKIKKARRRSRKRAGQEEVLKTSRFGGDLEDEQVRKRS